jgi:hypothetical protein
MAYLRKAIEKAASRAADRLWPALHAFGNTLPESDSVPPARGATLPSRAEKHGRSRRSAGPERPTACAPCASKRRAPRSCAATRRSATSSTTSRARSSALHPREGRQDRDGEDVPGARALRGHDRHRSCVPRRESRACSRAETCTITPDSLHDHGSEHHQVRPRRGAHRRPHQPLQHDVRPLLHGREPGGLRPRAVVGGHHEDPRRRDQRQAAPSDVGPVLGRRAHALAPLPRRHPLREEDRLLRRAGATNGLRFAQEPGFARRPPRRACAWRTCSSTASPTPPTPTARSANLYDVKLRAIEELLAAGIDVIPVVTIVNGVNNDQVGPIVPVRGRQRRQDHGRQRSSP